MSFGKRLVKLAKRTKTNDDGIIFRALNAVFITVIFHTDFIIAPQLHFQQNIIITQAYDNFR